MPVNDILNDNKDRIRALCKKYNVERLYAFGSVCTDQFTKYSDIDFLVTFRPMDHETYADHYFALAKELETLLDHPVDLVTEKSLSNPYFIKTINRTKEQIYG